MNTIVNHIFRKIFFFLTKPFTRDFSLLVALVLLVCVPFVIGTLLFCFTTWSSLIWELAHYYLLCYLALLLVSNLPKTFHKCGKKLLLAFAVLDFIIECYCYTNTGSCFYTDTVAIILGTNFSESLEFISSHFSLKTLLVVIVGIFSALLINKRKSLLNNIGKKISYLLCPLTLIIFCYFVFLKKSVSWEAKFYCKIVRFVTYELPPNLKQYTQPLEIKHNKDMPQYVVMILGESFACSHSSLYGYAKETNPQLSRLQRDSLLFVYEHAVAPATHTIACVKSIMSTYKAEYGDSINWYECETLPHIMSEVGYNTLWISNQSPSGMYDNVAARYAELCNYQIWCGTKTKGLNKIDYDGIVIDSLSQSQLLKDKSEPFFIVFHLMGSHSNYALRYPDEWATFSAKDYSTSSEKIRSVLADYDNSVLYNDHVVSKIMDFFSGEESIIFYFSDHGQDLFESSNDYCGHGKINNEISLRAGLEIPYMIYCSPYFQSKFPTETMLVKNGMSVPLCTENTIEFLTDIFDLQIGAIR